jgi:hypothetical protein
MEMVHALISQAAAGIGSRSLAWQYILGSAFVVLTILVPFVVWFLMALLAPPDDRQQKVERVGLYLLICSYIISAAFGTYAGFVLGYGLFVGATFAFMTTIALLVTLLVSSIVIGLILHPIEQYRIRRMIKEMQAMPPRHRPGYID